MRYAWDQGVDKHPEGRSRSLMVGLPVVFAALILGPLKLGHNPPNTPQTTAHNPTTALKQPFNLRSSGHSGGSAAVTTPSGQTAAYTTGSYSTNNFNSGSPASAPATSGTGTQEPSSPAPSGTNVSSTTTIPTSGGMGGGSGGTGGTTSSGPIPTTPVSIPGQSLSVGGKPIVSTSGLTLTLN